MIERSIVEQIRSRVDIAELVGEYVPLRRSGSHWMARCPFHEERTPSFNVSSDRAFYFCHGCKASGDAYRFYEQIEGVTFPEALRALAEKAGVELPETRDPQQIAEDRRQHDVGERLAAACECAAAYYERCLLDADYSDIAREALEERGIPDDVTTRFRLGYAPARWDGLAEHFRAQGVSPADGELAGLLMAGRNGKGWYDRFRHRLMFPVVDRAGRVVAFSGRMLPTTDDMPTGLTPEDAGKYINSPETPIYKKSETLYGLGAARTSMRQKARAILVEGNFDVVQMHARGFTETVAPLGTSFTDAQAKLLRRFAETVRVVFDGDEAGRKATHAARSACDKAGLLALVGVLPMGMDPDAYLRSMDDGRGTEGMTRLTTGAQSILEWMIKDTAIRAGDSVPERIAAARTLVTSIAEVADGMEREVYINLTADALFLARSLVTNAVWEQQVATAKEAKAARLALPAVAEPVRAGLTTPDDVSVDIPSTARVSTGHGLEALIVCPELLVTPAAEEFCWLIVEALRPLVRLAQAQWGDGQRLDAPSLLELCPNVRIREWVAARLMPRDDTASEKWSAALADAVATLRRLRLKDTAAVMKRQSERAGMEGDPQAELHVLNDMLDIRCDSTPKDLN